MSTKDITAKIRRMKRLQAKASELDAEIKAIQNELKAELTANNVDEMTAGAFKFSYKEVISNRFDTTAFKKTYSELYKQFTKQTTSRRFLVA